MRPGTLVLLFPWLSIAGCVVEGEAALEDSELGGAVDVKSPTGDESADVLPAQPVAERCRPGEPDAAFLGARYGQILPPSEVDAWQEVPVTLVVKNCSGERWDPDDTGIAASRPQNNVFWGTNRIRLPAPLPSDHYVRVALAAPLHAPGMTGQFRFQWQVIRSPGGWTGEPLLAGNPLTIRVSPPRFTDSAAVLCRVCGTADGETICAGGPTVTAPRDGTGDARGPLQRCIDAAQRTGVGTVVAIPYGIYQLAGPITLGQNAPKNGITLTTAALPAGDATRKCTEPGVKCAVLQADAALNGQGGGPDAEGGLLHSYGVPDLVIDHIVLDGNREARIARYPDYLDRDGADAETRGSAPYACRWHLEDGWGANDGVGRWRKGYNGRLSGCRDCSIQYSATVRALCGSGLALEDLEDARIVHSSIRYNGEHWNNCHDFSSCDPSTYSPDNMIADALTLGGDPDNVTIEDNDFRENTDIGGPGMGSLTNSRVRGNGFYNFDQLANSMIHLGDLKDPDRGKYEGTTIAGNTVRCGSATGGGCDYGISAGARPFHGSTMCEGEKDADGTCLGTIYQVWSTGSPSAPTQIVSNVVRGARQGITLSAVKHMTVTQNDVGGGGRPIVNPWTRCRHATSSFNIDDDTRAAGLYRAGDNIVDGGAGHISSLNFNDGENCP